MTIEKRKEYHGGPIFFLLADFDIELTLEQKEIVNNFVTGLDFVDQIADGNSTPDIYENALAFISGRNSQLSAHIPDNVRDTFIVLRNEINKKQLEEKLTLYARGLFKKRFERTHTVHIDEYIHASLAEAVYYAKIGVLFLPKEVMERKVRKLLLMANMIVRIGDNLYDLQEDYQKGQIAFQPNAWLSFRLRLLLIILVVKTFLRYPKKWTAFKITCKYAKRCITGKK